MKIGLQSLDYIIFLVYFIIVSSYGIWVYRNKGNKNRNVKDFFFLHKATYFLGNRSQYHNI
jgi:solute:Na+ symporter, SSS family